MFTVKDLIKRLETMPQNAEVVLSVYCEDTVYRCEYASTDTDEYIEVFETTNNKVCIQY